MLGNKFGHFDSTGKTFTVTDPGTPMPWVNVICNGRYGLIVSQNGGGFSWLDNSQLNVLTRWEMDLARDDHGKFVLVSDLESGEVWSLSPAPCHGMLDEYRCEHTQGSTTFVTRRGDIAAEWKLSVAPNDNAEVWVVKLTNHGAKDRKLRIASFFEWCCGVAPDAKREFHRLFFTTSYDAARNAIIAKKNMWEAPLRNDTGAIEREKAHWNKPWPYVAAHAVTGAVFERPLAIGDKTTFIGRYGSLASPKAMKDRAIPAVNSLNNFGRFGDASASLGGDLTLKAGASVTLAYVLAIGETESEVLELVDRYTKLDAAQSVAPAAGTMWDELLATSQIASESPDFDLLNSHWLPYQAISGRLWGRTGYYQQSGAFGFRDQLQDSQIWLPRDSTRTRDQIFLHAAHQFADGSVFHWWHPLAEFGLRTACSDDYLWLPFLTAQYIKDTGDWAILERTIPFVDDAAGATLLEHCKQSITKSMGRFSPRGLPLIGACDWNDGLSALGVEGKGESIWLAQFLVMLLHNFAFVVEHEGDVQLAETYRQTRADLIRVVNELAWDEDVSGGGKWYRAATRDDGRWIGTNTNKEGKVFLNTQTWAILADAATLNREEEAWASVKKHLLAPMGPLLSAPAYTEPDAGLGYITRYAPGLRENGGVYMHAATWALAAACKRRDSEAAEQIWRAISPPTRCGADADSYWAEPYVTPGNVDGPQSSTPGKAGWTWYTGSAAWLNHVCLEWIVGMRASWEGLLIDPFPLASLGRVSASRVWRGKTVRLSYDAREFGVNSLMKVTVNGHEISGNIINADRFVGTNELKIVVSWGVTGRKTNVQTVDGVAGVSAAVIATPVNGTALYERQPT